MTDPKTAAREVSGRLKARNIAIKHSHALDRVAAAAGLASRRVMASMKTLPPITRINIALLSSAATLLAQHDHARRQIIIDTTSDVLLGRPAFTTSAEPSSSSDKAADVLAIFAANRDKHVIAWTLDVVEADDLPTLFWNNENGWVSFDDATIFDDRTGALPSVSADKSRFPTIRWLTWEQARIRSAIDETLKSIDDEDLDIFVKDVPGERMIDYDRIASILFAKGTFGRPVGPLELAVRDGADRATLYTVSLSDAPDTAGGMVREWVSNVEKAFANGRIPDEDEQRNLLMEGDGAISNIRTWLAADDRLWAWLEVAGYPDAIDNNIAPADSGVTSGIRFIHDKLDFWISETELRDPEAFVLTENGKALIAEVAKYSDFSRWSKDSRGLEQDKIDEIATAAIGYLRAAKTDEERRFAGERALVENLRCASSEDDWYYHGSDAWSNIQQDLSEAVSEADLNHAYDRDDWRDAVCSAYDTYITDKDDSVPTDLLSSHDRAEVMFWLLPPKSTPDEMTSIAGPWPDPARIIIDNEFRFALAKLGIPLLKWIDEIGTEQADFDDEESDQTTPYDAPQLGDPAKGPILTIEKLNTIIENGCTNHFGLVLYAYVPLQDIITLDLSRPFMMGKAAVALYNQYAGTFHEEYALQGDLILKDGVDGRLEGLMGPSPKDFCGMIMTSFETNLTDPELIGYAKEATAALDLAVAELGFVRRFPGYKVDWQFENAERTALVASVGLDDKDRKYHYLPVRALLGDTITIEVNNPE